MKRVITFTTFVVLLLSLTLLPFSRSIASLSPTENRPVILLPGMTASINWTCFFTEQDCDDESAWDWAPTAQNYYLTLIDRFAQAGYSPENHYLSVFFYDWRKPLEANLARLRARSAELRLATGAGDVDLVGHSMGGLLGRAYVQSDAYPSDVIHLITLGSPHTGASKTYPYWQAANFYKMDGLERTVFTLLLGYYMLREQNAIPVQVLRETLPGMQDILSSVDHLYDEQHGDALKPEVNMNQRNTYLAGLNADLATLFARAEVSTFAGNGLLTPARFYVHDFRWWERLPWEWSNWVDGEPNWDRQDEFMIAQGDGTVLASSALLPSPADARQFASVGHGRLPADEMVMQAVFETLGIPYPAYARQGSTAQASPWAVWVLDGSARATLTDSLGRTLSPTGTTIPGAEYVTLPDDPFQIMLVPEPAPGRFQIDVQGLSQGNYSLSRIDTFSDPASLVTDILSFWDSSPSQIDQGVQVTFAMTYTAGATTAPPLIAVTPVINTPAWWGGNEAVGRALPGRKVQIFEAGTNKLLGFGASNLSGHFVAVLFPALKLNQRIYPKVGGVIGPTIKVQSHQIFLPFARR